MVWPTSQRDKNQAIPKVIDMLITSKEAMKEKSPPTYSHIPMVASKLAEASKLPVGDQETCRTVRVWDESRTAYATTAASQAKDQIVVS